MGCMLCNFLRVHTSVGEEWIGVWPYYELVGPRWRERHNCLLHIFLFRKTMHQYKIIHLLIGTECMLGLNTTLKKTYQQQQLCKHTIVYALVIVNIQQFVGVFKTYRFYGFVGGYVFYCAVVYGVQCFVVHIFVLLM